MIKEPVIDLKMAKEHGLSDDEFKRILEILDRRKRFREWKRDLYLKELPQIVLGLRHRQTNLVAAVQGFVYLS